VSGQRFAVGQQRDLVINLPQFQANRSPRAERRRAAAGARPGPEAVLLVLGCQRSGTTLMTRVLGRDPDAKVHPEHGPLTLGDRPRYLRLPEPGRLAERVAASRFPVVVLKPLVESQNAATLLAALPGARAVWMFRHWADVARSNLARFGRDNGLRNLRGVVEGGADDWRAEGVAPDVRRVVAEHLAGGVAPLDAAALFWWVRNLHFFAQGLAERPDVATCRYEELVAEPERCLRAVYALLGRPFPGPAILTGVTSASVGLGAGLAFSPEVAARCDALLERLQGVHEKAAACA